LIDAFAAGRDDSRIVRTVDTLYDFIRSHPFPGRWLREKAAMYRQAGDPASTLWGRAVLSVGEQAAAYAVSLTETSLALMAEAREVEAAYREAYLSDLAGLRALQEAFAAGEWDQPVFRCGGFSFAKLTPLRGMGDDPVKNKVSAGRD